MYQIPKIPADIRDRYLTPISEPTDKEFAVLVNDGQKNSEISTVLQIPWMSAEGVIGGTLIHTLHLWI